MKKKTSVIVTQCLGKGCGEWLAADAKWAGHFVFCRFCGQLTRVVGTGEHDGLKPMMIAVPDDLDTGPSAERSEGQGVFTSRRNTWSVASAICAGLGIPLIIPMIPAVCFGIVGVFQILRRGRREKGLFLASGMAVLGIVWLSLVIPVGQQIHAHSIRLARLEKANSLVSSFRRSVSSSTRGAVSSIRWPVNLESVELSPGFYDELEQVDLSLQDLVYIPPVSQPRGSEKIQNSTIRLFYPLQSDVDHDVRAVLLHDGTTVLYAPEKLKQELLEQGAPVKADGRPRK